MERSWLQITIIIGAILTADAAKQKRQIFREQVLPSRGGKIPEEAFRSDRLALNRLNKEGITVPDGVVLEARHVHKHPNPSGAMPEVLKVYLTPEGRYVPPEGRYHDDNPKAVDTTYLVRHPTENHQHRDKLGGYNNKPGTMYSSTGYRQFYHVTRPRIYKPLITPLIIPTRDDLLQKTYYHPSWSPDRYSWDLIYEPFDDYFTNSLFLFNSHQILTDYEGFLNGFHDRSARHTPENSVLKNSANGFTTKAEKSFPRQSSQNPKTSGYPDLTKIPETRFTCGRKRGIFADAETKCQVFHECGVNGKSSFLCPAGTVFSEAKKRCEWWDSVTCNNSSNRY